MILYDVISENIAWICANSQFDSNRQSHKSQIAEDTQINQFDNNETGMHILVFNL